MKARRLSFIRAALRARFQQLRMRSLIDAIGLTVALLVGLAGPIGYTTVIYGQRAELLAFKAQLNANRVAKYIFANERHWQYQHLRIGEITELPQSDNEPIRLRVIAPTERVVLEQGAMLSGPLMRREAPILVRGTAVGRVEIATSLTSFLATLALVGISSFAVGGGAYAAFRVLPLRVLDRTLGELETQNKRLDAALDNMSEGLCMFNGDQRLEIFNERYTRMYGLLPGQLKPGMTIQEILQKRTDAGTFAGEIPEAYVRDLMTVVTSDKPTTTIQELNDGRVIAVKYRPMPGKGWVATHEDITEQRRVQERVAYMAHHDGLTDLANRAHLGERLTAALADERECSDLAVLCLDLDRFKEVNDTLGHASGDELLKGVAERLKSCIRETDLVARLGGDEFAILQIGGEQPKDAAALAARLLEAIGSHFEICGQQVAVGTSIGIAIAPSDGTEADQLLRNADLALYRAKSDQRGTYRFFEPEMDRRAQARRQLELDLRKALQNGEFELYYQPLVNLERDEIGGFEALLRWNHPERGKILPGDFIPLAEETGLIVPIGEWVLRQACAEAAKWPDHIKVAVNISAVQFKGAGLSNLVISAIAAAGLRPDRLEIEITESVMLQDPDAALAVLTRLHDLGVRMALDDFGTGYSSLSNLRKFPFDRIKIDRSFVADLSTANVDAIAVVRSVAQLGVSLGMATTAEGVETKDQLDLVRSEGCTDIQGYFISRPVPASDVARLLQSQRAVDAA
jgi:diguanylate cyclase (GGDEF)-like protein